MGVLQLQRFAMFYYIYVCVLLFLGFHFRFGRGEMFRRKARN